MKREIWKDGMLTADSTANCGWKIGIDEQFIYHTEGPAVDPQRQRRIVEK